MKSCPECFAILKKSKHFAWCSQHNATAHVACAFIRDRATGRCENCGGAETAAVHSEQAHWNVTRDKIERARKRRVATERVLEVARRVLLVGMHDDDCGVHTGLCTCVTGELERALATYEESK